MSGNKELVNTDELLKKLERVNSNLRENRGRLFGAFLIAAIPVVVAAGIMVGNPGVGIIITAVFVGTGGAAFGLNLISKVVNERRELLNEKKEIIEQLKEHQANLNNSINSEMQSVNPLFNSVKNEINKVPTNDNVKQHASIVNALKREKCIQIPGFFKRLSGAVKTEQQELKKTKKSTERKSF